MPFICFKTPVVNQKHPLLGSTHVDSDELISKETLWLYCAVNRTSFGEQYNGYVIGQNCDECRIT